MSHRAEHGEDKLILMGRIGAAHGLKGQVRLQSFTEDPESIVKYKPLLTKKPDVSFTIKKARLQKTMLIVSLDGVTDRTAAEALNGTELFIPREHLSEGIEEDEFLQADLIGLKTVWSDGSAHGEIISVANYGAGDVLEVRTLNGEISFLPFTMAVVPEVNIAAGTVTIVPPDEVVGEEPR